MWFTWFNCFLKLFMLGFQYSGYSCNFVAVFTVDIIIHNGFTDNIKVCQFVTLQKVRLQLGGFSTGSAVFLS